MTQLTQQTPILLDEAAPASFAHVAPRSTVGLYAQMAKPRITVMVVVTAWLGYAMPVVAEARSVLVLLATLAGTALSCMGASVFNQVIERDSDAKMRRTMHRPIPSGRVSPAAATVFGLALSTLGVGLLLALAGLLPALLAAFTIASYVFVYTPMKRLSSASTIVGALPGALPPVIGYAAATGSLGVEAMAMFGIMFLWQLPHFLAIAWLYREDYARAGMPMLPVVDPSGASTFRQILLGCMTLLPLGLLPTMLGMTGMLYFTVALLCGGAFLAFGVALVLGQTRWHARAMFFASLVYLPVVLAFMIIDRA